MPGGTHRVGLGLNKYFEIMLVFVLDSANFQRECNEEMNKILFSTLLISWGL